MAYFLITGATGTGKTSYFINQMDEYRKKGENAVLIIPEQISLLTENKVIEKTGYLGRGIDVLSFGRLFHKIYGLCCGRKRNYVSGIGKTVIVNRILSKNADKLKIYRSSSKTSLMTGRITATLAEFKRHAVTLESIKDASDKISEGSASLKLKDLALIFEEYEKEISKFGFDADDNITYLATLIKSSDYVKNTSFLVDSFSSFTAAELSVLRELNLYSKGLFISLNKDSSDNSLFGPVQGTLRQLEEILGKPEKVITLTENKKHTGELLFLEENYARYNGASYKEKTEDIFLFSSESPYEETDMLARDIIEKTKKGYRFSDIGIMCPNPGEYSGIIESSFKKHGIRYYMNLPKTMLMHPVCLLFLSLFDIFISSFSYEAVFTFLKTGFIDVENVNLLENYVLDNGIKGSTWQNEFTFKADKYDLKKINRAREQFLSLVMPFRESTKGKTLCGDYIEALESFCDLIDFEKKTEKLIAFLSKKNLIKEAMEYKRAYECFSDVCNQLYVCMEKDSFGIEKLSDMMKSAFSESKLSTLPPSSDEILCAGPDEIRHHNFRILYIIGATDANFPQLPSGTGLLTDNERRILRENEIELAPDLKRKALEQPFKIYEILTIPTEKLIVSYPVSDISRAGTRASSVVTELKALFPLLSEISSIGACDESLISTARATVCQMLINEKSDLFAQAKRWYLENEKWQKRIKYILSAKRFSTFSSISEEMAERLWGKNLHATVSRLEAFAQCPFKFFATYGLKLSPRDRQELSPPDAGIFMHDVMDRFTAYVMENNLSWNGITKEDCVKKGYELSEESVKILLEKTPLMTKRHEFLVEKLKKSASDTLWAVVRQVQAGIFTPYASELDIGKCEEITPITIKTPKGSSVTLYGIVDRVDRSEDGYRIIDYKSSEHDINLPEVEQGISLQLFVYANALRNSMGKIKGMFYLTMHSPKIEFTEGMSEDTLQREILKSFALNGYVVGDSEDVVDMDINVDGASSVIKTSFVKKRGAFTRELPPEKYEEISEKMFEKITEYAERITGGDTSVLPVASGSRTACDFCEYTAVCGFEKGRGTYRKICKSAGEEE